ncbi:MAG: V-type ATPase 116kDa subunit family protein [Thermodesulfobacteriota bacterium]|nr:V-type ATPase 116kDa subunit family protein [Thermodesulfobacteriota bacterium]
MFRPVKLTRLTIQAPEDRISAVMAVLGDLRLLHLIRVEETHLGRLGYVAHIDTSLLEHYDSLLARANKLLRDLGPTGPSSDIRKVPQPDKAVFRLEEDIAHIETEALEPLERKKKAKNAISEHEALIARLQLLEPAEIDLDRLHDLRYVTWRAGLIPEENLNKLEQSLVDTHHTLIPVGRKKQRVVLLAMSLKEDKEVLLRALKSAFWDPLELPPRIHGTIKKALDRLSSELEHLKTEFAGLDTEGAELTRKYGTKLKYLREEILLARQLLKAQTEFGQIDHTYLLTGWIPVALFEELKKRILKATSGNVLVDQVDPKDIKEVRSGILKIPILFNNPMLIRPFERLTTLYGTPSYEELEPTVFLAVSFLLLFGMMFGDMGHGAILCGIGYYVFRKMYRYIDYGIILMECGVSSMIFGLLYGSIFGLEDLVPALWMHPMEEINLFMVMSAFFGVGVISLGLILNLLNVIRQHRYGELLSTSGLAGALLYWLGVGLVARYLLSGELSPFELMCAMVAAGALIILMILQRPVSAVLAQRRIGKKGGRIPPGLGGTILESFIEVFDDLLRYLTNTVSFVRVAAFALTHAGLFIAVFSLADMVRGVHGGGLLYWVTLIIGNVFIIALEGMVVSIQTIRLEYYEFFSKFFRGGGKPFQPLIEEE